MKPIKNQEVRVEEASPLNTRYTCYKCKNCGAINRGGARYSESVSGECDLVDLDGNFDNYESYDSSDFTVDNYYCRECEEEGYSADDLFVACDEDGLTEDDE